MGKDVFLTTIFPGTNLKPIVKPIHNMKNILKSATLLLAVFLTTFANNTVKAQCPISITSVTMTPATCFGGSDGTITICLSGGNAPFTYGIVQFPFPAITYTGNETCHTFTGLLAGSYIVGVQSNGNECSASGTISVTQPAAGVSVAMSFTPVSCNGGSNGTATATPSGGTGPYTYLWSPGGQTTQTATGLTAQTYTVTVTDFNGCSNTGSTTVTQPAGMSQTSVVTNVLCNGQSNGAIDLTVSGGTGPYTYLWSPGGQTTQDISGLAAGSYTVVITDFNGCTFSPPAIVVTQPVILSSSETHVNVNCAGSNTGSIDLSVAGGTTAYTYLWNTGQTTQDLAGLAPGFYSVTITDANGCTTSRGVTIVQLSNLSLSSIITDATCGTSNGAVNLSVSGGSGNYTYSWSPGGATTEDISGVPAGVYTVTVTDVTLGCTQVLANNVQNSGNPDITGTVTNATNCNASNGAIDITVTGGSGNYSYLWSPSGQVTQDRTNLIVGSYTVTVTDNVSGCIAIATFTVSYNNAMTLSASVTNSNCSSNSGAIDLTVSGGVPGFTYLWSNGATTQDLSSIGPGIYSVTVTDANGCTANSLFTVSGSNGITVTFVETDITCNGQANGSINLTVSGGSGNYSYSWSNGATTQDISSLSPGTYTVSVTDVSTGCSSFLSFTITQPTGFNGFVDITHVSCNGGNNGAIDLTIFGATPPYTYLWSPGGQTTQDISGLTAGNYTITITDANGCTAGAGLTVTQPAAINLTETHVNVTCAGGANGSINLSVAGGSAPYTYGWSNGATTQDLSGLSAGLYVVTVTDANGCSSNLSVSITELSNLTINIVSVVNSQCNANTGSIDISVAGGSGNYSYSWSPGGQITQDRTNLAPGIYCVTVTDITNGCVQSQCINISETGAPNVSAVVTPASDCAATNGAIDVTVSGGSGNYSYLWSPGAQTTQDLTNLSPGTYTVTVTDVTTGCSGLISYTVTAGSAMSLTATITNSSCSSSTGAIDLAVSGGTGPYTYLWTNGATTQDISGLAGAIYGVTVTDANGCTENSFFTVSETSAFTLSAATTNINCAGGVNGAINLTVSGGSGNYTYVWSNGATTQDLSSIPAGTYSVSVTDVTTGCTSFDIYTVTEPAAISLSANVTNIPCNGSGTGSIDITVSGGTGPYNYAWAPGGQTTQDISGLALGTYTLTFSDANGCGGVYSYTVAQPTAITITETHTNVTCNGLANGAINITVSGGTAPYSYLWAPSGQTTEDRAGLAPNTYTVTVTDINGCNSNLSVTITQPAVLSATETHTNVTCFGVNNGTIDVTVSGGTGPFTYLWTPSGETTQDRANLAAGTYSVAITDANGCTTSINNIVITQPGSALTVNISPSVNITCFGLCNGTATVNASGGSGGYTYLWTPGGQTTQTATGLCPNIYNVAVTDASGCTASATVTIIQPGDLVASATGTDASCNGVCDGTAIATQVGGTSPFTYFWLPSGPATNTVNNLCAGTFQVVVTDFNGCDDTASVTINEPAPITYTSSATPVVCNGQCNGTATVTPAGGFAPYTYLWSPGGQTTQTAINLCLGVYTCTITDSHNCTTTATVAVPSNSAIVLDVSSNDPNCNGVCNGSINTTVSGGTPSYIYLWTPGNETTSSISNLCAGTYTVTVTDNSGCQQVAVITLNEPSPIVITSSSTPASCNGVCDASASISASGGTPGYTYLWSPGGETTTSISNVCAGTYSVTVTDANGCTQTSTIVVSEPTAITLNTNTNDISCNGNTDGSIDLSASGGTPGYTYLWSNGQTSQDLSNLAPGTYSVTVTDANGCTATASVTITEPSIITMSSTTTPATCGACDGTGTVTPSGGTGPYSYLWGTGATTATAPNLCAGVYPVFITDANGCVGSFVVAISNLGGPSSAAVTTTDASCFGTCDGTANVTGVTGGAAPYTYLWVQGGATTTSVSGLCAGTYFVQISDTNNCTLTQAVTVSEPSQIVANETVVTADCGLCNGSIVLAPSGGTGPYTYLWGGGETTNTITGLCAGVYTVDITDANNCVESVAFPVNNLPTSSILLSSTAASCSGTCDGTATVTVTLGTPPYSYLWSDGQTDATAINLCAGVYTVQVTDLNNCIATDIINVNEPAVLALSLPVVSNITCNGACDGTIAIIPSGGTLPYSYLWSDGQTTATATNLCPGAYSVTVTDANGCTNSWSDIPVTEPTPIVLVESWTDALCFGSCDGTATVSASGGIPGYTYLWTPGNQTGSTATALCAGTYIVQVTDANGCIQGTSVLIGQPTDIVLTTAMQSASCNGVCDASASVAASGGTAGYTYLWTPSNQTGDTATALCAGIYTVTVTDAQGCTKTAIVNVTEPAAITMTFAVTNVTCFGFCNATITATPSGGTSPYTYQWLNTTNLETVDFVDSLCPGEYYLLVTDANGCTGQDTAVVTEPTLLGFTTTVNNNVSCGGLCDGSASATPSGGTPGYTYLWSPSGQTDSTAINLCAGTYTVTVTDANGCDTTQIITITEPPILTLYPTTTNASCGGICDGTATAHVGGGTPPYQYQWSDGQTDSTAVGLCAGNYSVLITDGNGCTITVNVIILEPPVISSSITDFSEILCVGSCDAYATVAVTGGVPPYNYLWSNGQTDTTAINLCVGVYTVVVTDAIGCNTTATVAISDQNALATAIPLFNNVSCFGDCDGNATAIITGGLPPYAILWSDGQTTEMATDLCPGTYTVTVTDAANCVSVSTITITEPELLTSTATETDASCGGTCDGTATVTAVGGTQPFTYIWVPGGQTTATATGLCAGTYTVTVTDANGCTTQSTVTINEPPILLASTSVTAPTCSNTNNGAINLTVSGGVPGYTYAWSPGGATTQNLTDLLPGVYNVTVTDNTGCTVTLSVAVIEQVVIDANAGADVTICIGETVQLQATGGSSYLWTPASGLNYNNIDNPVATVTTTTTYIVQVSNFSCVDYDTVTITVNPLPVIDAGSGAEILAGTTVQLQASGAGTNGTYSWSPTDGLDNPNIYNPIASPVETTYYYVTGTDENGCSATDSLTVEVSPGIVFPDGITPNDDGKNDTWIIDFINNFPEAVVMVYNRWGQELFYSKGYGTPWDGRYKGKDLPVGTYYYVIDLHNGKAPYTGPITIAR